MTISNKHKCPSNLWRKFSNNEKRVYNTMFEDLTQEHMTHPKSAHIPRDHWATIRHNASCLAAWSLRNVVVE